MKTVEVAAAVIRSEDESGRPVIYATCRGYGGWEGYWEFPGGKLEEGETPRQALIREIREELDIEIEVGDYLDTVEYDYPDFHLSMECYICRIACGEPKLLEHEAAVWVGVDDLESLGWLPADRVLLPRIKELMK
ncbi:(deoxy)nucleoside triphosphate pyrophosphohydrolase [Butyrivibrio sp. MC2013]|uniref:(deoxy)nucleoside triphosphate pyrophosphohydrolase n=1 Tax=Butyrivibrio sp. MC2013 TaxID=1280686 RepID=UPI0003F81E50|nr:(deoxy)nucleoside triphosphate pyrophosphohydrolase [Butyrivibrio sp. MC2013]